LTPLELRKEKKKKEKHMVKLFREKEKAVYHTSRLSNLFPVFFTLTYHMMHEEYSVAKEDF